MGIGGARTTLEEDNDRNPWNGIYPYPYPSLSSTCQKDPLAKNLRMKT
jgi:hypothetical protein